MIDLSGRLIHQSLEGRGLVNREVREHLAVDLDPRFGEPADKSTVGEAVLAHRRIDPLNPKGAEIPLLQLAADVVVLQRAVHRGVCRGDVVLAAAAKALGLLQDLLAAGVAGDGAWGAGQGRGPLRVGHPALYALGFGGAHGRGAAQLANLLVRALDHAVAFASLAMFDFAARGEPEPLLGARLGLQFGHFASPWGTRPRSH